MHSLAPPAPVLRYEEEEEDSDEEDVYAPELPPDLAAARANANPTVTSSVPPAARRPIGPARGPLQREEEEEESEDEIGPAPPGPSSSSLVHEDAVIDFMQKEAQRRQAIEVRFSSPPSGFPVLVPLCACASLVQCVQHVHACKRVRQCYLPTPLLYRRRHAPRRFSVKSGCSSRPHHQIYSAVRYSFPPHLVLLHLHSYFLIYFLLCNEYNGVQLFVRSFSTQHSIQLSLTNHANSPAPPPHQKQSTTRSGRRRPLKSSSV
jgi:hypothetical protein